MRLARATQGHGMVQGLVGEKVVSQMVDDIIIAFLVDQPEFYVFEFSHFQGLLCGLMPEIESQDSERLFYCIH